MLNSSCTVPTNGATSVENSRDGRDADCVANKTSERPCAVRVHDRRTPTSPALLSFSRRNCVVNSPSPRRALIATDVENRASVSWASLVYRRLSSLPLRHFATNSCILVGHSVSYNTPAVLDSFISAHVSTAVSYYHTCF